jgi:dTDP-4-dehydrorhamnose reductase
MTNHAKILIIGGNGFVGSSLSKLLSKHYQVYSTYHRSHTPIPNVIHAPLPLLSEKDLCERLIQAVDPAVVIYCLGTNNELDAERDPRGAQALHSGGLTHVIHAADMIKAKFIYISSDFVFSGLEGNFVESDSTVPSIQLGKAKLGAENIVKTRSLNHLIIRCAPLIGRGTVDHDSWLDRIRESVIKQRKVEMPSRAFHNPVHISFLAEVIQKALERDLRNRVLHVGGLTKITPFELGKQFLKKIGLPTELVEPADSTGSNTSRIDYTLNFTETLKSIEAEPLLLEQSLDLL